MVNEPIAVRYAEALFDLGKREGTLDALAQELEELVSMAREHPTLRELLLNPDVDIPDKLGLLGRLMGGWSTDLQGFVRLVLTMERATNLLEMAEALRQLVDKERRICRVTVRTARPLAPALRERLTQWLGRREQCQVALIEEVDAALIGGIEVTLDHRTFDGSLRTQLERLRHRLRSVRVH